MTHDQMIEVLAAHRDGKRIEFKCYGDDMWKDCCPDPTWSFYRFEYRIKPEPKKPREWTMVSMSNTGHPSCHLVMLDSGIEPGKHIRVREVLND